jgi:uncharacterized protein YqhQ
MRDRAAELTNTPPQRAIMAKVILHYSKPFTGKRRRRVVRCLVINVCGTMLCLILLFVSVLIFVAEAEGAWVQRRIISDQMLGPLIAMISIAGWMAYGGWAVVRAIRILRRRR